MKKEKVTAAAAAVNPSEAIELGSGNVFQDLGLSNPEERLVKSNLAIQVRRLVRERGLTQQETAALVGIDQAKVSNLMRGKLSGISVEKLFSILNKLGRRIEIRISEEEYAPEEAHTCVLVG